HSYDQGVAFLQALSTAYPTITELVNVGTSLQNRTIWALRITANPTVPNPSKLKLLFTGVTHAREWATHEAILYMAEMLTHGYATDPHVQHILDRAEVWVIPTVNPDGYVYSWSTYRMQRKNMRDNPGTTCDGVDINRNYARGWGGPGASASFCDETYRG